MKVKLTYFKQSGKYYSEGEYDTEKEYLFKVFEEVKKMAEDGCLPGLMSGRSEFHVLIDVPDHPHNHPHLVLAKRSMK